jgi:hypothetical protein
MHENQIKYERIADIEPQLRFSLLLNKGSGYKGGALLGLEGKKILLNNKNKNEKIVIETEATESQKTLDFVVRNYGYGQTTEIDKTEDFKGLKAAARALQKMTFFQKMALNLNSALLQNLPTGMINNYLVAASGKYGLDTNKVTSANKEVMKNIIPILGATVGHININDAHYLAKLAYTFNGVAGLAVNSKTYRTDKNPLDHYLDRNLFYMVQAGTEVANQIPLMVGYLNTYKLTDNYTMFDAVRVNGLKLDDPNLNPNGELTLEYEDGNPVEVEKITESMYNLNTLLSEAQGDYGEYQRIRGRYEFISSLGLTFAGWVYPNMRKRFSTKFYYDQSEKVQEFGGYQTSFILSMFNASSDFYKLAVFGGGDITGREFFDSRWNKFKSKNTTEKVESILGGAVNTITAPLQAGIHASNSVFKFLAHSVFGLENKGLENNELFNKLLKYKTKEEIAELYNLTKLEEETQDQFDERVKQAHNYYLDAMRAASNEYAILITVMLIGIVAQALNGDDEEEKNKILKSVEINSRRLYNDLILGAPLLNPFKPIDFAMLRSKDPLVLLSTIDITSDVILGLIGFQANLSTGELNFNIDDKYTKSGPGYEKGELKIQKKMEKFIGPWGNLLKFSDPERQEKLTDLFNKNAIFTDKDLSEKDGDTDEE